MSPYSSCIWQRRKTCIPFFFSAIFFLFVSTAFLAASFLLFFIVSRCSIHILMSASLSKVFSARCFTVSFVTTKFRFLKYNIHLLLSGEAVHSCHCRSLLSILYYPLGLGNDQSKTNTCIAFRPPLPFGIWYTAGHICQRRSTFKPSRLCIWLYIFAKRMWTIFLVAWV